MRTTIVTILAAVLAGCGGPMGLHQAGTTTIGGKRLADALTGRAAGSPLSCLPSGRHWTNQASVDGGIAFTSGRQTYVATFGHGCRQLGRPGTALVTRSRGRGMCQGDIAPIVDTSTGITVGSCVIGPFIPYNLGRKWH